MSGRGKKRFQIMEEILEKGKYTVIRRLSQDRVGGERV